MKINWCIKQEKGLELINKNNNLSKEYLVKAENALRAIKALENNSEWQISAAYYASYFSLYSILMKIGVKSEIHVCTIEFANKFLNKYFTGKKLSLLKKSMKARIDLQYYTDREVSLNKHKKMIEFAYEFRAKCKEIIQNLDENSINNIRSDFLCSFG